MKKLLLVTIAAIALPLAAPANAATLFNGHYYEFVAGSVTWQNALSAAASATPIAGYTPHLVTVTSAAEDNFVANILTNDSIWLAGSDEAAEGVWRWMAGPETGQIFFGPGAPAGSYTNWNGGEPNNSANEDYLHTNVNQGNWNDVYPTYGNRGYVVEWSPNGAVPEPATWAMLIFGFALVGAAMRRNQATSVRFAF